MFGLSLRVEIGVQDVQRVQVLALILVQALNLYVEDRVRIHRYPVVLPDILRQPDLVFPLDFQKSSSAAGSPA